ncbi:hypothetical protein Q8A67_012949 [Cirrhinus molitorella]|uniref:Uncharacterized protein n=1 Tax=Cirrhinus molitorella TaxID=172907 RepID=A0AA88PU61_9TELE|nr:hypothetical protein Q8A67_012949 [Cirrhinus molitorella]
MENNGSSPNAFGPPLIRLHKHLADIRALKKLESEKRGIIGRCCHKDRMLPVTRQTRNLERRVKDETRSVFTRIGATYTHKTPFILPESFDLKSSQVESVSQSSGSAAPLREKYTLEGQPLAAYTDRSFSESLCFAVHLTEDSHS